MSYELQNKIRAIEATLAGERQGVEAAVAVVDARVAALEAVVEALQSKVAAIVAVDVVDERPPMRIPPFPKALKDIGLVPPEPLTAKVGSEVAT